MNETTKQNMKKIIPIIALFLMMLAACQHRESGNSSDSLAPDSGGHYIMIKTLSDEDQWLKVSQNDLKSDLTRKLADAYNAAVVKIKNPPINDSSIFHPSHVIMIGI